MLKHTDVCTEYKHPVTVFLDYSIKYRSSVSVSDKCLSISLRTT